MYYSCILMPLPVQIIECPGDGKRVAEKVYVSDLGPCEEFAHKVSLTIYITTSYDFINFKTLNTRGSSLLLSVPPDKFSKTRNRFGELPVPII